MSQQMIDKINGEGFKDLRPSERADTLKYAVEYLIIVGGWDKLIEVVTTVCETFDVKVSEALIADVIEVAEAELTVEKIDEIMETVDKEDTVAPKLVTGGVAPKNTPSRRKQTKKSN